MKQEQDNRVHEVWNAEACIGYYTLEQLSLEFTREELMGLTWSPISNDIAAKLINTKSTYGRRMRAQAREFSLKSRDRLKEIKRLEKRLATKRTALSHYDIEDLASEVQSEVIENIRIHLEAFGAPLTEYQTKVIKDDFDECHYDDTMRVILRALAKG